MLIITKSTSNEHTREREVASSTPMTELENRQRKNRFTFYFILLLVCMVISFWSGYRLGRTVGAHHNSHGYSQKP